MILPLMDILGLDRSHLYAIPILFDENGEYAGFDITADVTKMDGKGIIASKYHFILMFQYNHFFHFESSTIVNIFPVFLIIHHDFPVLQVFHVQKQIYNHNFE